MTTAEVFHNTFVTRQPGKALYTILISLYTLLRLPMWLLWYIPPSLRQHPRWTYRQAISTRLLRVLLTHRSITRAGDILTLAPGAEKDRFTVVHPTTDQHYTGILHKDKAITPQRVGATWYPAPYQPPFAPEKRSIGAALSLTGDVVLHFHGGAYTIGNGRTAECGFLAHTLLRHTGGSIAHVLCPDYRLASSADGGGRFPAALQDAVSCYAHLLSLGIPAARIVLSGDSAGANLAIALLRYIADSAGVLPPPACAWLWSPWVDPAGTSTGSGVRENANYGSDYVVDVFPVWGARLYAPEGGAVGVEDPYVSPMRHPFKTETPVWVMTGGAEVLRDDDVRFAEGMKGVRGNVVGLWVEEGVPHDIAMLGELLGWVGEMEACAERAGRFLRENRRDEAD